MKLTGAQLVVPLGCIMSIQGFFNDMCNAQSDNFSTTNLASPRELHTQIGMSQLLSCKQNTAFDTAGSVRELLRC
jgi:hypothetical protein